MFYNILGILIGILLILHSFLTLWSKKENKWTILINLICSIGILATGISGFFVPKDYEYITILLLMFFSISFLVYTYIISKKNKNAQKHKVASRK